MKISLTKPTHNKPHKRKILIMWEAATFPQSGIDNLIDNLNHCGITAIGLSCSQPIEGPIRIWDLGSLDKGEVKELVDLVKIYSKQGSDSVTAASLKPIFKPGMKMHIHQNYLNLLQLSTTTN